MTAENPVINDGVTHICGSDRYPYTIIDIRSKNRILVRECNNDLSENLDGEIKELYRHKDNLFYAKGSNCNPYIIGTRRYYLDPSF